MTLSPLTCKNTKLALMVAVPVVLSGCSVQAAHTGPSPSTAPVPAPASTSPDSQAGLSRSFTSTLYGYTMSYPEQWTVVSGTQPWQDDSSAPGVGDLFQSPDTRTVSVVSQPIPETTTDDQWIADYLPAPGTASMPQCYPPKDQWTSTTVDGHSGGILGGVMWCGFTRVIVIADHRAYLFNAVPDPAHLTADVFDQSLLNDLLASVRLTPGDAP
jgi:hypothetical protein